MSRALATHPQQFVQFEGRPQPIEDVVDILRSTSKAKDEYGQSAEVFTWLGRRMGLDQFPATVQGQMKIVPPSASRFQAQFDACCKVAVKR